MADLARYVDIWQEVHLDRNGAITGAVFAATTLYIEGETALLIPTDLGLGRLGKESADLVEYPGICRWV